MVELCFFFPQVFLSKSTSGKRPETALNADTSKSYTTTFWNIKQKGL